MTRRSDQAEKDKSSICKLEIKPGFRRTSRDLHAEPSAVAGQRAVCVCGEREDLAAAFKRVLNPNTPQFHEYCL